MMKVFIPFDEAPVASRAPLVPFDRQRMQVVSITHIGACDDRVCEIILELGQSDPISNAKSETGYGSGQGARATEL